VSITFELEARGNAEAINFANTNAAALMTLAGLDPQPFGEVRGEELRACIIRLLWAVNSAALRSRVATTGCDEGRGSNARELTSTSSGAVLNCWRCSCVLNDTIALWSGVEGGAAWRRQEASHQIAIGAGDAVATISGHHPRCRGSAANSRPRAGADAKCRRSVGTTATESRHLLYFLAMRFDNPVLDYHMRTVHPWIHQ
jgi:hypothetical protein